jgi:hypothetical protein
MVNVSATGWTPQDAARSLYFGRTRPRLLLCAFAEQPVVGVLNTLQVKTRHADGASLRIRQDGEELFDGDIPPHAEIGIVPLSPAELIVSLTLEPGRVVHNFRIRPQVVAPEFSKIDVARKAVVGDNLPIVWDAPSATSVTCKLKMAPSVQNTRRHPPACSCCAPHERDQSCCASSRKVHSPQLSRRALFKWSLRCRAS